MKKYRGISYTVEKPKPLDGRTQLYWSGQILFPGKPKDISHFKNRARLIEGIKHEIDAHIDRLNCGCDDAELYGIARHLEMQVTNYRPFEYIISGRQLTRDELLGLVDRICEYTKGLIDARRAKTDRPGLAAKLRKMTVKHGCTPDEAAAAKEKLRQLSEGEL